MNISKVKIARVTWMMFVIAFPIFCDCNNFRAKAKIILGSDGRTLLYSDRYCKKHAYVWVAKLRIHVVTGAQGSWLQQCLRYCGCMYEYSMDVPMWGKNNIIGGWRCSLGQFTSNKSICIVRGNSVCCCDLMNILYHIFEHKLVTNFTYWALSHVRHSN